LQTALAAVRLDPTFWYAHFTLSLAEDGTGDRSGAEREAASALGWMANTWPPPPSGPVAQLHNLRRYG
jgi:hypothetical protein